MLTIKFDENFDPIKYYIMVVLQLIGHVDPVRTHISYYLFEEARIA